MFRRRGYFGFHRGFPPFDVYFQNSKHFSIRQSYLRLSREHEQNMEKKTVEMKKEGTE